MFYKTRIELQWTTDVIMHISNVYFFIQSCEYFLIYKALNVKEDKVLR